MRFTKIVATIGPATNTTDKIRQLADTGVNVCRMNFSHGNYEAHGNVIKNIKAVNKEGTHCLGIMLDTKGPEVRTGDVKEAIKVKKGDLFHFVQKATGKEKHTVITVDYDKFADDVKNATTILMDNGAIEFKTVEIGKNYVVAKALEDGKIGSRRHINLPGAYISLPSFTDKDWSDIKFGVDQGVDFFATSFVRSGDDIRELRKFLDKHKSQAEIIAKIETPQAVQNIDDIIQMSDSIMIARGDLGAEIPFEDVPRIQKEIIEKCRKQNKPVIVATHMLESMIVNPMPTRAEVTDIAHAAVAQADCTMLSGETANGLHPYKAVNAMSRILLANEVVNTPKVLEAAGPGRKKNSADDMDERRKEQALAASVLAQNLDADALVVISKHGITAKAVSNCRPLVPIYAFSEDESVQRRLSMVWGVVANLVKLGPKPEDTVKNALSLLKKKGVLKKGRVVIVSDILSGGEHVMTVQIRKLA